MVWQKITSRLFKNKPVEVPADKVVVKAFRKRYARFRKLLDSNAALAELMADMEVKLRGTSLFGLIYVRNSVRRSVELTQRMARSLEDMSGGRRSGLEKIVQRISDELEDMFTQSDNPQNDCPSLTMSLQEINLGMVDWVGGKSASLGEMQSMAGIPVPRGFGITVAAYHSFMAHEGLGKKIEERLLRFDAEDREALSLLLEEVRALVEAAPLPEELSRALARSLVEAFGDESVRLAVRSSAQAEDGEKSFAGQFLTELNVSRADLEVSYKRVVASLFTPSATMYRIHQGIPLIASAMAVLCLEMVDSVASGVAYSHDPINLMQDTMIVNGVWGLGRYAVDGMVEPDFWVFTREEKPQLVRRRPGMKDHKCVPGLSGELVDMQVEEPDRKRFCLSEKEAADLAGLIMRLDKYYGRYQDIEWAKTADGRLIFLQSRPLEARGGGAAAPIPPLLPQYPLLLEGGDIAYPGVGYGPVVMPVTPEDLLAFPQGGVLVAVHSSAEYAAVMDKAQAVITQTGGVTGHMATICREFRVPTLLNVKEAMKVLQPGMEVTVDAFSQRIYQGKAEELLPLRLSLDPIRLQDTPVHMLLREAARLILPLNLTDPNSAKFTPENCRTLHDVMRYTHELSYHEMFAISDSAVDAGRVALKLKAPLPIDLHIIDLDNGAMASPGAQVVTPEQIVCAPLKALLAGMLLPEVVFRRPRPINMSGFISVMGQQIGNPQGGDGRFGDKSYAIISDRYLNFSSRVGYHYSVLDSYCGQTASKNYISFNFQGGAAGEDRRVRRIKAIALVLGALGFQVTLQGDAVKSRLQKYPRPEIEQRLDQLGRLLQVTRQMDMLMTGDESIIQFKEDFMNGIYR